MATAKCNKRLHCFALNLSDEIPWMFIKTLGICYATGPFNNKVIGRFAFFKINFERPIKQIKTSSKRPTKKQRSLSRNALLEYNY